MEPEVWGDESEIVAEVVGLIARRITRASDPKTTARPASELAAEAGRTITAAGLGATEVLRIFEDVLVRRRAPRTIRTTSPTCRQLPFWFSLAVHGTDRYTEAIEQTLTTARAIADGIRTVPTLDLLLEPELSVLIFERPGFTDEDYHRWSTRLAHEGLILCVPTVAGANDVAPRPGQPGHPSRPRDRHPARDDRPGSSLSRAG